MQLSAILFTINCIEKAKIKKNEVGNGPICETSSSVEMTTSLPEIGLVHAHDVTGQLTTIEITEYTQRLKYAHRD